ncbi:hypothetical protein [Methylobacterium sp. NFXW15]|uniref:hypothetical protein n=1 Tax=Methylobacterium sp. NFXW15 TaxID=2819512 RepID=UPI003CE84AB7
MNHRSNLIDLEFETARLGELLEQQAPEDAIEAECDRVCMQYFGYTRHELTQQVPAIPLAGLDEWYYDEVLDLGERHGFDFREKKGSREHSIYRDVGYVVEQWVYIAEMLIAKECGFFPSTFEEIATVKMNREARVFEEAIRREKQKPRRESLELAKVFGERPREIKPGTIVATPVKGKGAKPGREVRIEVRSRDRRPLPMPPKKP